MSIKEWIPRTDLFFIILVTAVFAFGLIMGAYIHGLDTPEPTETSQAETWWADGRAFTNISLPPGIKLGFNPETHYVVREDTTGLRRKLRMAKNSPYEVYRYVDSYLEALDWCKCDSAISFGELSSDGAQRYKYYYFDGFEFTTDSTIAQKKALLLTPEEEKELRKIFDDPFSEWNKYLDSLDLRN